MIKQKQQAHLDSIGNVTQYNSMMMSAGGETTPSRKKKGDNTSWTDVNLTGLKNKKTIQSI
jgi:hypothetical protein